MIENLAVEEITDHGPRNPRSGRGSDNSENSRASPVVIKQNPYSRQRISIIQKIGTWNVRSLFVEGKTHNLVKEMQRLKMDVLGVSEMRWPGSGKCQVNGYHIYYSGNNDPHHWNGVGIIISQTVNNSVKNVVNISDRVILIQLETKPIACNIIQAYAPTCNATDNDIELFYGDLKKATDLIKSQEVNILMGDFNAKIGAGRREDVVGDYGMGISNDRGDRLVQFCLDEGFVVMNTFFKHHARRLYTWKSNADPDVRNQIDYILVNRRFRNIIKNAKTYPGADVYTDHNLLAASVKLKLKRCVKLLKVPRLDTQKLKDPAVESQVRNEMSTLLMTSENATDEVEIEHTWNRLKTSMKEVGEKYLKPSTKQKKQPWMTNEILDLMELRRTQKNRCPQRYKEVQREIRSKIRTAKEKWLSERCEEIEVLDAKHDSFNMHKKVKQLAANKKHRGHEVLMDEHNNILTSTEEKLKEWNSYIRNLFNDNRSHNQNLQLNDGIDITRSEVEKAITLTKNGKAPGPDEMYVDVLKVLKEDRSLSILVNLFNNIYRSGMIPADWLKSTFVTLPKKRTAKRCQDYRTISLMSHVLKIFLKIVHSRIHRRCEATISDTQFGFRNGFGTREALFSIQVLIQRCRDVDVDVYACFLDYEKAFDTVNHEILMTILKELGLDGRDIRIIANLYWGQTARVRINGELSEEVLIQRGVRQGCVLSPLLFNIYAEKIIGDALDEKTAGIVVGGTVINNLRYADDTVLLATNIEDLQELLSSVAEYSTRAGLKLNINKTKWFVVSRAPTVVQENLKVGTEIVERVKSFKYLGSHINEKWDMSSEIRSRIEQARLSFTNMRSVLTNRFLSIPLRIRLLRCYVFSTLYYGVEAWTLTEAMCKKLQAFEMWTYRRLLKIPWTDHATNIDVLERVKKPTEVLNTIKRKKLEYFGHVIRNEKYRLLQVVIQGKIEGKRGPGRRRISWLKNLRQWYGQSTTSLFRKAADKVQIMQMIVNALGGHDT